MNDLKNTGYIRLKQIIGNKKDPESAPIIPVSKSTWWQGVKEGRYPAAVKLSARTTAWRVEDIRNLIERMSSTKTVEAMAGVQK